jgi:hypothetical protein
MQDCSCSVTVTVGSESMMSLAAGGVPLGAYALNKLLRISLKPRSVVFDDDS